MGKGLGPAQLRILTLLLESGGALAVRGILASLDKASTEGPGTKEYNVVRSSISRTLRGLRIRNLVDAYSINVAGHVAVVVSLTKAGAEVAQREEEA